MAVTVTVTGTAGPGNTLTAAVFTNVSSFTIDSTDNMLTMNNADGRVVDVSIAAATTITATKSGSTYTLTIS